MLVTNQTTQDYWFGPLHLPARVDETLTVDGGSADANDSLDAPAWLVLNFIIKT